MSEGAKRLWLEEDLETNLKWSYRVHSVLYSGSSEYQEVDLVDTPTFGKVLLLDGKMQSTDLDETFYHELLVHPALLQHPNPKRVFIMGGGEGSTAREVLRHKSVEEVVMVDIDKVVTDFCSQYLPRNAEAFKDPRLKLTNDDAAVQLEKAQGTFDVIIGDLADPLDGGPCYQLYTSEFYKTIVKPKLSPSGIFITQAGPAGFTSCKEVFSSIHQTMKGVFPTVIPYAQHFPSFCDCWGYNLAFNDPQAKLLDPSSLDSAIASRIEGPLEYVDGETLTGLTKLNKHVREVLKNETRTYTKESASFIFGSGLGKASEKS